MVLKMMKQFENPEGVYRIQAHGSRHSTHVPNILFGENYVHMEYMMTFVYKNDRKELNLFEMVHI